LADNVDFPAGGQLYLWVFDNLGGAGSEWALFSDPAWRVAVNDGLDPTVYFFGFGPDTVALFGHLDLGSGAGATDLARTAAAPDPVSVLPILAAPVLALGLLRRRFRPAAGIQRLRASTEAGASSWPRVTPS